MNDDEYDAKAEEYLKWAQARGQSWIDDATPDGYDLDSGEPIISFEKVLKFGLWSDIRRVRQQMLNGDIDVRESMMRLAALMDTAEQMDEHAEENRRDLP